MYTLLHRIFIDEVIMDFVCCMSLRQSCDMANESWNFTIENRIATKNGCVWVIFFNFISAQLDAYFVVVDCYRRNRKKGTKMHLPMPVLLYDFINLTMLAVSSVSSVFPLEQEKNNKNWQTRRKRQGNSREQYVSLCQRSNIFCPFYFICPLCLCCMLGL